MRPFSEQQQEAISRLWLTRAIRYAVTAWGPEAEEYAGIGLAKAVASYDLDTRANWPAWMIRHLRCSVADGMRAEHGRRGSARQQAGREQFSVAEYDRTYEQQHLEGLEHDESLLRALQQIEQHDGPARWAMLGMVLGDMSLAEAATIAGVQPARIRAALLDTRKAVEQPGKPARSKRNWLDMACRLARRHPDWPDSRIAAQVGVHRSQLARSVAYQSVKKSSQIATRIAG